VSWRIIYTRHARKDAQKLAQGNLKNRALELLPALEQDPFQSPPPFENLLGDLQGAYSRRINSRHRLVYQVLAQERVVKILRMWSHHE